jgi:hypothetical protein
MIQEGRGLPKELGGPPSTQELMQETKEPIPLYVRLLDALYLHWYRMSREG